MSVLILNCGSSSVKYAVFDDEEQDFVCRGIVERVKDHDSAVREVLRLLTQGDDSPLHDMTAIEAVGHRVVHGGEKFARSARITDELLEVVEEVAELAPLHNPPNLAGIRAARNLLPDIPHVAVFDTAFHQSMPPEAYVYPLPYEWYQKHGVRRYGFHGTSHLYVSRRAAVLLKRPIESLKMITLHVGNGASATAILGGHSVDTSMGLTPLEGLVMGTRCGWIDPAVPLFMMERKKIDSDEMDRLLNKKSGLLGVTGKHSDRRDILEAAASGDRRSELAVKLEVRSLKKVIGSYATTMGGLDCLVFTAGVGENAAEIRARVLRGLNFLGIEFDPARNQKAVGGREEAIISTERSRVAVLVIPTNEELVIAEDTCAILHDTFDDPAFRYSFEA